MRAAVFLMLILHVYTSAISQDEYVSARVFHNYKGYALSAGLPYLTLDELYKRTDGTLNPGFAIAFSLGSTFPSGRSMLFEPALNLFLIQRTTFERAERQPVDNSIIRYHRTIERVNTLNVLLPLSLMTNNEKKLSFGGGLYASIAIAGNGRVQQHSQQWAIIFPPPPTGSTDRNYSPKGCRTGYSASIQFVLAPTGKGHQRYLRLSYMHDINQRRPAFTRMNAVMLVFGTRKVTVREKRERWDTF